MNYDELYGYLAKFRGQIIMSYLRRIRNFKITSLNLDSFQFVAILLGALFFYFGYLARDASVPPFFTTFLALFFGGLLTLFVTGFVNGEIDKAKSDYNEEKKALEKDIEKLKGQIGDDSDYRFAQELEFLSILFQELGELPVPFPIINKFCSKINYLNGNLTLKRELKYYLNKVKDREIALTGLHKGFTKQDDGQIPFLGLVGEACNHVLKLQISEEWAYPLYNDIEAYLQAWLVCSIKNNVIIRIEPFVLESLGENGKGRYRGKETYIEVIKYIKSVVTNQERLNSFFTTPDSRNIVNDCLQELINLLEKTESNLPYSSMEPYNHTAL